MQQDVVGSQLFELSGEMLATPGIRFDADNLILQGLYTDELSAHRAKKGWAEILELNFLLDRGHDFTLSVVSCLQEGKFLLTCEFHTACGRYAFWRLTNNQSPEAQYIIETAHIPDSDNNAGLFFAADMAGAEEDPYLYEGSRNETSLKRWVEALKDVLSLRFL